MKIISNYESSSIDVLENNNQEIVVSPKKEKDGYSNYYNFTISNLLDKEGKIIIKNLNKMKYIPSEYNLLFRNKDGLYEKISKDRIKISKNNVEIKILKNEEIEVSSYPRYTYSDLINYLNKNNIEYENINNLIKITIGDTNKETIFIVGRQHPGETLSSYFIEGIINYLINNKVDNYCFMIYPIVSVNGVKNGNHRYTDNYDYNRMWNTDGVISEIDYIKNELSKYNVSLFIDVHGDEVDDFDYIRTRMKLNDVPEGVQVLRDRSMLMRIIRELIKQGKLPDFSSKTSREFVSSKYKCNNMLVELSLSNSSEKEEIEKGSEFIKMLSKR